MKGLKVLEFTETTTIGCTEDFEAPIKYICTSQYATAADISWCDHLERAQLAQAFAIPEMESHALTALEESLKAEKLIEIVSFFEKIPQCQYSCKRFEQIIQGVHGLRLDELVEDPSTALDTGDQMIKDECLRRFANQAEDKMQCGDCEQHGTVYTTGTSTAAQQKCRHDWAPWSPPPKRKRNELEDELADELL